MARITSDIFIRHRVDDPADKPTPAPSNGVALSRVSHELRTPLNAIIGFAELSEQQPFGALAEPYLGYMSSIRNAAEHLLHVVNDILDLEEIESGRAKFAMRPVRIAKILRDAREIISDRAKDNDIDISSVEVEDSWLVSADADHLKRICVNLLDNAVKFTPAGGRIGVDLDQDPSGALNVTFWDTGPGIPAERQTGIFDGFNRDSADPFTTLADDNATGLGLAVARLLAQRMQGDITLQSEYGRGARFILRLPALPSAAQAAE